MKDHIKLSERGTVIICAILSMTVLVVDVFTPVGVNTPLLYLITIFLALSSERIRIAVIFGLICSVLTIIGIFLSIDNNAFVEGAINRALVLCLM